MAGGPVFNGGRTFGKVSFPEWLEIQVKSHYGWGKDLVKPGPKSMGGSRVL